MKNRHVQINFWITILSLGAILIILCSACGSPKSFQEPREVPEESIPQEENVEELSTKFIQEFNVTPKDLLLGQVYSGLDSIILVIEDNSRISKVDKHGKFILENQKNYSRVVIPPFTPGIIKKVNRRGEILVVFGKKKKNDLQWGPNKNGTYVMGISKGYSDKVFYGKKLYRIASGKFGTIFVDTEKIDDSKNNDQIEPGKKVSN
jgi:hypothetical protein